MCHARDPGTARLKNFHDRSHRGRAVAMNVRACRQGPRARQTPVTSAAAVHRYTRTIDKRAGLCWLSRLEGESQHRILFTTVAFMMVVVVRIVRRLVSSTSIEEMRHSSSRQVRLTDDNSFAKWGLHFR